MRNTGKRMLAALALAWISNCTLAANDVLVTRPLPVVTQDRVSNRLIVKLKPTAQTSTAVDHVSSIIDHRLSVQELDGIQAAAGIGMTEHHMMSSGAHILSMQGVPSRVAVDHAIAGIARLPNVEYVEEDRIDGIQMIPNDTRYGTYLWGMQPVIAPAQPSTGGVGSYGADFQTAWDTSTGSGVVVAVVDTGITPHIDIGGPNALVAGGPGSNLISAGYTFISDCRMIDPGADPAHGCAPTTTTGTTVAPFAGALDTGDFLTAADCASGFFPAPCTASNSSWHGTHVAGIIAALGNNNLSVIGGAFNARILPVRVIGKGGAYLSDIAEGIYWAAGVHSASYPGLMNPNPARVINLSVGGLGPCGPTQQAAIDAAVAAGAVVVVAAGNQNTDAATVHPASCNNVISVAAIAKDGSRASYSNFSSSVPSTITLSAPGSDALVGSGSYDPGIWSTTNSGATTPVTTLTQSWMAAMQGTSMAAPHVSAAAALVLARNPSLAPAQVKSILSASASVTTFPSFVTGLATTDCALNNNCGAGILNVSLAVRNTPAAPQTPASSGGGGGGCSVMPAGAKPDASLLLAMLAVAVYWLRRRGTRERSAT